MARVHSNKEVSRHSSPRDAWVVVDGHVYDVSGFLHSHPGGLDVLDGRLGTDISDALRSPDFHRHSSTAFQILEQCRIGVLEGAQPHVRTYACSNSARIAIVPAGGCYVKMNVFISAVCIFLQPPRNANFCIYVIQ